MQQQAAVIEIGIGVQRLEGEGALVPGERLVEIGLDLPQRAAVVHGVGRVGRQRQYLLGERERFGVAALPQQNGAEIDARLDIGGVGGGRAPEHLLRLGQSSRLLQHDAQHAQRRRMARVEGDGAVEGRF